MSSLARGSEQRYRGMADNYRSWIHHGLADPDAADWAAQALEATTMVEPRVMALLDVADSH